MTITASAPPARLDFAGLPLEDSGKLLLRLSLGLLMLFHGVAKVQNGIDPILGALAQAGLPVGLGYLVYLGEVVAPLLLIAGVWTRSSALVIAINMVFAVALVHQADLGLLSKSGGWALELQAFYFVTALAIAMLGGGRLSIGHARPD